MTDAFNAASSAFYTAIGHASDSVVHASDLAVAHPILVFQIAAVISIAVVRTGSQIR